MEVSIIIPVYNSSSTILNTLKSVLNQTFQDFEVIIVDDGSTDNSTTKIEKFIEQNLLANFHLISQINKGASAARNSGMKKATGNYIALLDSDDEWKPNKLEKQITVFKTNQNVDLLGTNRNGEFFEVFMFYKFTDLTKISTKMLLWKMFLITPTVVFKSDIIRDVGFFDEKITHAEDANFFLRISLSYNCYLLNESLVITGAGKHSFGESGLSSNMLEMKKGEVRNLSFLRKENKINYFEYILFKSYTSFKFARRILIVIKRKLLN